MKRLTVRGVSDEACELLDEVRTTAGASQRRALEACIQHGAASAIVELVEEFQTATDPKSPHLLDQLADAAMESRRLLRVLIEGLGLEMGFYQR